MEKMIIPVINTHIFVFIAKIAIPIVPIRIPTIIGVAGYNTNIFDKAKGRNENIIPDCWIKIIITIEIRGTIIMEFDRRRFHT